MSYFKRKNFDAAKEVAFSSQLNKNLTAFDLTLFGLGGIIGTGVFVITGFVSAEYSGPAITISYIIAGITCIFVALAYSELATMLPTSGSLYTYSYVAFGECAAWIMGSIMLLELCVAAAAVASGWSGYMKGLLSLAGFEMPKAFATAPAGGGVVDLLAVAIIAFVALVLYFGNKDSKRVNAFLVFIKIAAIFTFVVCAVPHFNISNWDNFMPFGFDKMITGASFLFFAFTGFGTIVTASEECKNPSRDITIGVIGSLLLAILIYVIIAALTTGIVNFSELNNSDPLTYALSKNNSNIGAAIVATGAICGMTTVIMVNIYGVSRIFYVIARDGLLPKSLTRLHGKYQSPYITTTFFSFVAAVLAGFFPLKSLSELSSVAALLDYIMVTIIVMLFRLTMPNAVRSFKCPALFIIGPIGLLSCVYLLLELIYQTNNAVEAAKIGISWLLVFFVLYAISLRIRSKTSKG